MTEIHNGNMERAESEVTEKYETQARRQVEEKTGCSLKSYFNRYLVSKFKGKAELMA